MNDFVNTYVAKNGNCCRERKFSYKIYNFGTIYHRIFSKEWKVFLENYIVVEVSV